MRSSSSAQTIIGTGLLSNSRRNEASRCFSSVMSTRRPMTPPSSVSRSSIRMTAAVGQRLLVAFAGLIELGEPLGDPLFLAADRFGIVAALDADADGVLAAARPARTGRRCGCRFRRISCSRECSGRRHRETRCPAAGCRSPRAAARVDLRASAIAASASARLRTISPISAATRRRLRCELLAPELAGRPRVRAIAACLCFLAALRPILGIRLRPLAFCVPCSRDNCLKKRYRWRPTLRVCRFADRVPVPERRIRASNVAQPTDRRRREPQQNRARGCDNRPNHDRTTNARISPRAHEIASMLQQGSTLRRLGRHVGIMNARCEDSQDRRLAAIGLQSRRPSSAIMSRHDEPSPDSLSPACSRSRVPARWRRTRAASIPSRCRRWPIPNDPQARRQGTVRPQGAAGGDAAAGDRLLCQGLHRRRRGAADQRRDLAGDAAVAQPQLGPSATWSRCSSGCRPRRTRIAGWPGLLVGDMSQPRGGPMLTGHASHQVGLDADIWLTPMPNRQLSRNEREEMSAVMMVRQDRLDIDPQTWTPTPSRRDPRRRAGAARSSASSSMPRSRRRCAAKPRATAAGCRRCGRCTATTIISTSASNARPAAPNAKPQPPPAEWRRLRAGDLAYWFSDAVLHPKPPKVPPKPKPPMTLAQLPPACRRCWRRRRERRRRVTFAPSGIAVDCACDVRADRKSAGLPERRFRLSHPDFERCECARNVARAHAWSAAMNHLAAPVIRSLFVLRCCRRRRRPRSRRTRR